VTLKLCVVWLSPIKATCAMPFRQRARRIAQPGRDGRGGGRVAVEKAQGGRRPDQSVGEMAPRRGVVAGGGRIEGQEAHPLGQVFGEGSGQLVEFERPHGAHDRAIGAHERDDHQVVAQSLDRRMLAALIPAWPGFHRRA
jgi:hypothetical protein